MSSLDNHIVLINFDFPPNYGIGGRRWGKFAKELASRQIHVHVIKAKPKDKRSSHWSKDVQSDYIHVYEFDRKAELNRWSIGVGILDKITYRLALWLNLRKDPGTPYDLAIGTERAIHAHLHAITTTHQVEWIIATGAPFNILFYTANFVLQSSKYKYWADLRDPWLDAVNYGMSELSGTRNQAEYDKASAVLKAATIVSCPTYEALRILEKIGNGAYTHKLYELRHFYDPAEVNSKSANVDSEKLTLVYGGDIYPGTEVFLAQVFEDLRKLKRDFPDLYNRMNIRFYSDNISRVNQDFSDLDVVSYDTSIGNGIFDEIAASDWNIILLSDFNRHFFTTKYFEYEPFGKPYMYIGPEGKVAKEIQQEHIGLCWSEFLAQLKEHGWKSLKTFKRGRNLRSGALATRTTELLAKMAEFD
jgi:hypothetical protein